MKLTPVRSIKEYDGPKTHRAILFKIQEDARNENKVDLPFRYIDRMVDLFFSNLGIGYYFKRFQSFSIVGLGRWIVNYKGNCKKKQKAERLRRNLLKSRRVYMRKYSKRIRMLKKAEKKAALSASKRVSLK